MKRLRTNLTIFCVTVLILSDLVRESSGARLDIERKNLGIEKLIACNVNETDERTSLITYRPINQPTDNVDGKKFDITLTGFANRRTDSTLLISTLSRDSCSITANENENENVSLPTWKINNQLRKFRLKINHETTKQLAGSTLFLCVFNEYLGQMQHLGANSALKIDNFIDDSDKQNFQQHRRMKRNAKTADIHINGFRIESSEKEPEMHDGVPVLRTNTDVVLRLFGSGFKVDGTTTQIGLTIEKREFGDSCMMMVTEGFDLISDSDTVATANIRIPDHSYDLFICISQDSDSKSFIHQGTDSWLKIKSAEPMLPFWMQIGIIMICLCFSALFSGLNLGLMALDRTDLKILCNTGSDNEKRYAHAIQPVRDHGNFLLCSILLGNVLVNSTFTILLDSLTSGLIAVVCSTLLIVVFGEITPQAICSRHGLAVGAKTIVITKFVMLITFPLSYPTSKILDYLLGEEIGTYYNRERLNELVKVTKDHNDLDKDEVNIISGVLEMRKKTVGDVMTPIEDAYMLPIDSIMDFETISKIMDSGYSRIPVYEDDRKNILSVFYVKDLAFVDPEENTQLRILCEYYENPCHFVFDDMTLDVMFKQFKEGNRGHMAFVHRVNNDGDGDPFYETIGLVTLEDVIEELIQAEIMDETDRITDNRTKKSRAGQQKQDFSYFIERRPETQKVRISPQMTLATFQFLSTTLEPFKRDNISENILRRLLNQDVFRHVKNKTKDKNDPSMFIFNQGKSVDFFVLILEGRVEVTVGRESLIFESGPFTHFGLQALAPTVGFDSPSQNQLTQSQVKLGSLLSLNMDSVLRQTFIPDYSVKALTDVVYLMVKRSLYLAAKRATLMDQSRRLGENNEPLDDEVEKLLHSLEEDDSTIHTSTNANSPRISKPSSPTVHNLTKQQHTVSAHQLNSNHNENDVGYRVNFTQNATSDNQISATFQRKNSSEINHDEVEAGQPLLKS